MKKSAVSGIVFALALLSSLVAIKTFEYYNTRIYPRTSINGIAVGGLSIEQATTKLEQANLEVPSGTVKVIVDDIQVASESSQLGLAYKFDVAARRAYISGKNGSEFRRFLNLVKHFFISDNYIAQPAYKPELIKEMLTDLQLQVDVIGERPSAQLTISNEPTTVSIEPGSPGRILEVEDTINSIQDNISHDKFLTNAVIASTSAILSEEEIVNAKKRTETYVGQQLIFNTNTRTYTLSDKEIVSLLTFPKGFAEVDLKIIFDDWVEEVNREPQDASFEYDKETLEVIKFIPHKEGLEVNKEKATTIALETLSKMEAQKEIIATHDLPVNTTQPNTSLADSNDLGITERIGFGNSEYDHSIPNRIHNVKITTDRITNTIVPPGAEFSFNKTLGEVSARTGYRSAYVIKNGRTELGDGGGVCQVSTTLFRAVLNAGLPVTRRLPHSYRVGYYELDSKPGVDATVYSGNVDLRFINDTGNHLLIHGNADSNNLYMYFEIYGTSDGRTTEIVDHEVWGYQPPPPPETFEDPSKPVGYREQVDWAAAGIKASFTNVIKSKDGEIIREEDYYSNYRPWAAKYVVGTGTN